MPKISRKLVTVLVLSVLVWFISGFIQAFIGYTDYFNGYYGCSLTGYPIALCISGNTMLVWLVSGVNILIWFGFLRLLWQMANPTKVS